MKILYLGDFNHTSAEYLKDCLHKLGHNVIHRDASQELAGEPAMAYDAFIVSDYPARYVDNHKAQEIINYIEQGSRFLMLGGWDSFNGQGINYYGHPLAKILSVELSPGDDRKNVSQGLLMVKDPALHEEDSLDWSHPSVICGYNMVQPKDSAQVLVWAKPIHSDGTEIELLQPQPLVIKGLYGKGTTIACLTDLAPHWCGGLVDWGEKRLVLPHVEVGDSFLGFIKLLLTI